MRKTKTKRTMRVHKKFVSGVMAALAFTILVGSQLGNVQDSRQLAADIICNDGSTPDANYACADGSRPYEVYQNNTNTAVDTVDACQSRGGQWYASSSTCSVSSGSSTNYPSTQMSTDQMKAECTKWGGAWDTASNYCKMPNTSGDQMSTNGVYYPTVPGGDPYQYKTDATCKAANPEFKFNGTYCYYEMSGGQSSTTYPSTQMSTDQMKAECTKWGGAWDTASNYCKMPNNTYNNYPMSNMNIGSVDTVGACQGRGGQWYASSSTCSVSPGSQIYNGGDASSITSPSGCTSVNFSWSSKLNRCFNNQAEKSAAELATGTQCSQGQFWNAYNNRCESSTATTDIKPPQYEVPYSEENMDSRRAQEEGNRAKGDLDRIKKDLERTIKRGGETSCPAIVKAQTAITKVETAINSAVAGTASNSSSLQTQLYGSGYGQDGLIGRAQQAIGMAGMCEGLSFMKNDIKREGEARKNEISRITDATIKAQANALLAKWNAIDPSKLADWSCEPGPNTFCDPMRPVMDTLDDLRWEFRDIMDSQRYARQEQGVCGNLDGIRSSINTAIANGAEISEDLMKKAYTFLETGLQACSVGKIDEAARSLANLERLKGEFEKHMYFSKDDNVKGFGQLDVKNMMRDSFSGSEIDIDALMAKLEERILSKMINVVQVALDEQASRFMAQFAQLESKPAIAMSNKAAAITDNIMIGLSGEEKDNLLKRKSELLDVVAELDKETAYYADDLSGDTKIQMEKIYDLSIKTWSEEGSSDARQELNSLVNALSTAASNTEARQILEEEAPAVLATLEKKYEEDKAEQLRDGTLAFADLYDKDDQWYSGWATAAKKEGVLNGEANSDGTRSVNPERATNVAEGITMLARQLAGGEDNVSTEVDNSNPVVARMPEWAKSSATDLAKHGVDLVGALGNMRADESLPRGVMMNLVAQAFKLEGDLSTAQSFSDAGGANQNQLKGAAALIENGIVDGETLANGEKRLNLKGELNRAAFAKIVVGVGRLGITGPQGGKIMDMNPIPSPGPSSIDESIPTI